MIIRIQLAQVIGVAAIRLWRLRKELVPALLLPALATAALQSYLVVDESTWIELLIFNLVNLPIYTLIAISTHRAVLVGPHAIPSRFGLFWSRRETRFLGWLFLLSAFAALVGVGLPVMALRILPAASQLLPAAIGLSIFAAMMLVASVVPIYFLGRLSFLFPSAALDHSTSYRGALEQSIGNGWRLVALILVPSILAIGFGFLEAPIATTFGRAMVLPVATLSTMVFGSYTAAVVSIAYGEVTQMEPCESPA